jgi:HSP20 family protein
MLIVPVTRSVTRANGQARDFGAFDRLFDDAFDRLFGGSRAGVPAEARAPAIDVVETESQYTVTVDLPGVARGDVKVSIDGKRVSIEAQSGASAEKTDGERVVYSERPAARFARSFTLPLEIDQAASQAKLDNGVLSLVLAKKLKPAAAQLTIN